jgi:hypothetical protein
MYEGATSDPSGPGVGAGVTIRGPGGALTYAGMHVDPLGNLVDRNGKLVLNSAQIAAQGGVPTGVPHMTKEGTLVDQAGNPMPKGGGGLLHNIGGAASATGGAVINPDNLLALGTGGLSGSAGATDATKAAGVAAGAAGRGAEAVGDAIGDALGGGGGGGPPVASPDDFRQRQLDYDAQLQAVINGTAGPSAAAIQGTNAQDRAIAQQFAAAQGATGANTAMAYRQALQNAAGISQQAGADAATLRAKEVADAQAQRAGNLSAGRGGDTTKYSTDVGAGNVRYAADKDFEGKKIAAATGAGSGIVGAALISDERKKTGITDGDDDVRAMLDALKAHDFQYKEPSEPGAAPGKRTGVMAQDLEKSMAGRALVHDTPDGKVIDSPQAIGAMLAALADMNKRMRAIEGRR